MSVHFLLVFTVTAREITLPSKTYVFCGTSGKKDSNSETGNIRQHFGLMPGVRFNLPQFIKLILRYNLKPEFKVEAPH